MIQRKPIEDAVLASVRSTVAEFLDDGGEDLLRSMFQECLDAGGDTADDAKRCDQRIGEINARIDELLDSLTPTNKEFVDKKLKALKDERDDLVFRRDTLKKQTAPKVNIDGVVHEIIESIRKFDDVFAEGTREEQKEFLSLFVEGIEINPKERRARLRIRKFPAPSSFGTGNDLLVLVAGAGSEHQKIHFPPVKVVDFPMERRGSILAPIAA